MYLAILAMILPQKELSAEMDTTGTKLVLSLDLIIGDGCYLHSATVIVNALWQSFNGCVTFAFH